MHILHTDPVSPSYSPYWPGPSYSPYWPGPSYSPYWPSPSYSPYWPGPSYSPYWPSPYTFHKVLTRRICIKIKSFFSWRSFPLLNSPDLHDAWFRGDIVMRNMMLVTRKGHKLLKMHINWLQHMYYLLLKVPMTQIFVFHFLVDS